MTAPEPLRVLSIGTVYPPHLLGGYEVIWRGVMAELRSRGSEARVLVSDLRRPEIAPDAVEDPDVHRELRWYWRDHGWPSMGLRERVALERHNARVFDRHLRELRPQVVTWWPLGGLSLGLVERARRAGLPSLFFVLDPWPVYGPRRDLWTHMWSRLPGLRGLVEWRAGLPTRLRLAETGRWLFCSEAMRQAVWKDGPRPADHDVLVPGVAAPFLELRPEPEAAHWGWQLLYAGRVVWQKGIGTAVEALAELPAEATLRIVGEGDDAYRRELEARVEGLGLGGRVRFEPPRPHEGMAELLREADVVVFPVIWSEPWGLVPLEAMAVGRPVVATGRGGSGDYLRDGENSLLFEAGDATSLAAAVRRLAQDPQLRERLRRGGRATAETYTASRFNRRAVEEIERAAGALSS